MRCLILNELGKIKPELNDLIQNYQIHLILNNAKEKVFDFEDSLTKQQKEYIAKGLKLGNIIYNYYIDNSTSLNNSDIEHRTDNKEFKESLEIIEILKKEKKKFDNEKKQILQAFTEKQEQVIEVLNI